MRALPLPLRRVPLTRKIFTLLRERIAEPPPDPPRRHAGVYDGPRGLAGRGVEGVVRYGRFDGFEWYAGPAHLLVGGVNGRASGGVEELEWM